MYSVKQKIGVSVAAGLGMGAFMFGMTETTGYQTVEEVNEVAVACAEHLGEKAIVGAELPGDCAAVSEGFPYVQTIVREGKGYPSEYDETQNETRYTLPSKDEFLKDTLVTEDDFNAEKRIKRIILALSPVLFGAVGYACITLEERLQSQEPEAGDVVDAASAGQN